jgi:hypothetical protein
MPYGWITTAPIRQVDADAVAGIASTLRAQVAAWGQGSQAWDQTRRYHTNVTGADSLLQTIEIMGGDDLNYVYEFGGLVLGLLMMSGAGYVADLLAHPGTEGCGATLLEHAVNVSRQHGGGGRLRLSSLNQNSSDFYLRMGFVRSEPAQPNGGGNMTLDPTNRTDLWRQSNGDWQLLANVGKRFAGRTD